MIVKGRLMEQRLFIYEEPILTVLEKPIKSLGRLYNSPLKDTEQAQELQQDLTKGMKIIDTYMLPGKLKI